MNACTARERRLDICVSSPNDRSFTLSRRNFDVALRISEVYIRPGGGYGPRFA